MACVAHSANRDSSHRAGASMRAVDMRGSRTSVRGSPEQESLRAEVLALEAVLDAQLSDAKPWLCGFSNGAAMAAALLLSRPERYRGGLLLSGPIVDPEPWPRQRLRGLSLLMVYGAADQLIPRELLQKSSEYLASASGAETSLRVVAGGHEISAAKLRVASEWFARQSSAHSSGMTGRL